VIARVIALDRHTATATISVDMGPPGFQAAAIISPELLDDVRLPGCSANASAIEFTRISMGNPHAVIFGHELNDRNVRQLGAMIERHSRFPSGTNVEWVHVISPTELKVRVWERGSGETLACGSGACAVGVAAVLRGISPRNTPIKVALPGGRLEVCWSDEGHVLLTGPSAVSFRGTWQTDVVH
jgi:diaminopimelate epimerase